jgi:recombination DNA repair RAD52 pathway protein
MRYTDENGQVVEISDAIWGCCPYSAITNLQEANIAYEFESGLATDDALVSSLSQFRQILSNAEAQQYM